MKKLFLISAMLASATCANASVLYDFQFNGRPIGSVAWQFTVADYLSAPGTTFITSFDSVAIGALGNMLDVRFFDPFSTTPGISTDGDQGSLSSGSGWTGPFDHNGTYINGNATLVISGSPAAASAPEPAPIALVGAAGLLLAFARRKRSLKVA